MQPDGRTVGVEQYDLAAPAHPLDRCAGHHVDETVRCDPWVDDRLDDRPTGQGLARSSPDLGFQTLGHGQLRGVYDFAAVARNRSSGSAS